jgi:phosphohistidine phosphatase
MKLLTLIRHAKSSWNHPGMEDFARPLNRRGKRDAEAMGKRLAAMEFMPDLLLSSPAKRARGTAKRVAKEIEYPKSRIEFNDGIYHAVSDSLLRIVRDIDDAVEHAALVGHNPGFSEFSALLSQDFIGGLPTCAVVRLQLCVNSWQEVSRKCGTLIDFDYPKRSVAGDLASGAEA